MPTEEYNDNLHKLIVDRLKERDRKQKIIRDYEKPKKMRLFPVVGLTIAACLSGVFFLTTRQTQHPMDAPIRSSMENVQVLIDEEKYGEALVLVEKELHLADSTLDELRKCNNEADDEVLYEIKVQELRIHDLTKEKENLEKKLK